MGQQTHFSRFDVPFVSGVELGVSITSPSSAAADVAEWLEESIAAVHQLDALIVCDIINKADARGAMNIVAAGNSVVTLTSTLARQLAMCRGVVDALTSHLPDLPTPALADQPPIRRHITLRRAEERWRATVDAWRAAEAEPMPVDGQQADDLIAAAGDLWSSMIETPAPTVEAVVEKCALARGTGLFRSDEFMAALQRDLEALLPSEAAQALADVQEG
ncbi:hypothetical protein WBP07_13015 [Novosphingobium sp. BL-8A]|uniref:hypothetical protein n=1 Tax=Novosphingobium sp. BL-8A TaxID=3127639 RepID=UPI0037569EFA